MEMELKWTCPKCGKVIFSKSDEQQKYNTALHLEKHKRKEEMEIEKERNKKKE